MNHLEITVDVALEPSDVYHPLQWSLQNLARWVSVATAGLILSGVSPLWPPEPAASERKTEIFLLYLLLGLVSVAVFLLPYLGVRRTFQKAAALRHPRHYIFNAAGIRTESEDARADYKWSLFTRIRETKSVFLLYQAPQVATYIPKRCFHAQADIEVLRQLIRDNYKGKWTVRRAGA
jgi:hypothetical protein